MCGYELMNAFLLTVYFLTFFLYQRMIGNVISSFKSGIF